MAVQLLKQSIHLGIITKNAEGMLGFYRDLLGFREEPSGPSALGGVTHKVWCGDSLLKIVELDDAPESSPSGSFTHLTGYRYYTMFVANLEEIMDRCAEAGATILTPLTVLDSGLAYAMVEDPDGNCVEFARYAEGA